VGLIACSTFEVQSVPSASGSTHSSMHAMAVADEVGQRRLSFSFTPICQMYVMALTRPSHEEQPILLVNLKNDPSCCQVGPVNRVPHVRENTGAASSSGGFSRDKAFSFDFWEKMQKPTLSLCVSPLRIPESLKTPAPPICQRSCLVSLFL
jgi:hypothetical protein